MFFYKRYEFTERDESGKLLCVGGYATVEEFDRAIIEHPPIDGHIITLFDSLKSPDDFGLSKKVVRQIIGTSPV